MNAFPLRDKKLLARIIAILLLLGALLQFYTGIQSLRSRAAFARLGPKPENREKITLDAAPAQYYRAVNAAWLRGAGLLILSLGGFYYSRKFAKNVSASGDRPAGHHLPE